MNVFMSVVFLQRQNLSPEEYQMRHTQLLNRQQMELAGLDGQLAAELKQIERGALANWEVRYAQAKLQLRERHYKVG